MARKLRSRVSSPSAEERAAAASWGSKCSGRTPSGSPSGSTAWGLGRLADSFSAPSSRTRAVDSRSSRFSAREMAADTPKKSRTAGSKVCTRSIRAPVSSSRWSVRRRRESSTASALRRASWAATHFSRKALARAMMSSGYSAEYRPSSSSASAVSLPALPRLTARDTAAPMTSTAPPAMGRMYPV